MTTIKIAERTIGQGHPPYVIAEMSGNHNGDINRAMQIMAAAKSAGADAIKLQTYTADTLTIDHDGPDFQINDGLWDGRTLYELYQEASTPWQWHEALFAKGRELGITVFSSPFDETAVDFLEKLGAPAYKIASFEAVDLALIEKIAATGKPMILSTGMVNLAAITTAVQTAQNGGCQELALLHCVSGYPTPLADSHLLTIPDLARRFGLVVGLSDHTLGITAAIVGTALGASIIEKHMTLDDRDQGPDVAFSLNPAQMQSLCSECHTAWSTLGRANYDLKPSEKNNTRFQRSLYVVRDMAAGEPFTKESVRCIRPGFGLAPSQLQSVLEHRAAYAIPRGTALTADMLTPTKQ